MRLFIAININENVKYALLKMQNDLKRCGIKGSFTREENLHMTLAFIGENDDPGKIEKIMRNVSFKAFPIRLSGFRLFKDIDGLAGIAPVRSFCIFGKGFGLCDIINEDELGQNRIGK
ncbi:MAG: hypothetical protein J6I76_02050 [Oribacterium sp.]|nr:hypothetical protein [Oribacterium sp.]